MVLGDKLIKSSIELMRNQHKQMFTFVLILLDESHDSTRIKFRSFKMGKWVHTRYKKR